MFEAKLTIELPGIADAINNLADAIRAKGNVTTTADAPEHKTRAKRQKAEKPVEEQAVETEPNFTPVESTEPSFIAEIPPDEVEEQATPVEPVISEPVAVPQSAPPVPEEAPAPAKKYTFKQLSNAGAKLVADMGKMEQLVKLLNDKYGVPAITMIPEDRYPELADDLIALGAEIKEE